MSQEGMRRLMAYHWPGNVRQLENVVERSIAFSQGRPQVEVQDLTLGSVPADTAGVVRGRRLSGRRRRLRHTSRTIERSLIKQSLERTRGNKRQAAKLLNLKRTTLVEKLKRLEPLK